MVTSFECLNSNPVGSRLAGQKKADSGTGLCLVIQGILQGLGFGFRVSGDLVRLLVCDGGVRS